MSKNTDRNTFQMRIAERIKQVMEKQGINQATLLTLAEQHGYHLRQSTLSKMLSDASSMSIANVVQIANTLRIDLNDLLSESSSLEVRVYKPTQPESSQSRLVRRADSLEMRPYLNPYYTYFFPTLSSDDGVLSGKLCFTPSEDNSKCLAQFSFETGKRDAQNRPITKEYHGELILSPTMSSAYCMLINEEIGEISYILFNYIPIIYENLYCRVALALTASAGANRMPTAHRMIITKEKLSPSAIDVLKGQLFLNESEILISEAGLERFLQDPRLDDSFKDYFCKPDQGIKFAGLSPVPYYFFDESIIRGAFLDPEIKNSAINLIRQYYASPKYNKVGTKCDEIVYKFIKGVKEGLKNSD